MSLHYCYKGLSILKWVTTEAFFGFISRVIQTIQNVCMLEKSEKTVVYWWMEVFRFTVADIWFWCSKVFLDYESSSRLFDVNVMWLNVLPLYLIITRRFLHFVQCMYYCSAFIFYVCFYFDKYSFFFSNEPVSLDVVIFLMIYERNLTLTLLHRHIFHWII